MLANRLSKTLSLLRIGKGFLQACSGDADATRRNIDSPEFQAGQNLLKASPFRFTNQVCRRDAAVLKYKFGCINSAVTELVEFPGHCEPRSFFDEQQTHSPMGRLGVDVGLHQDRKNPPCRTVGNPSLSPIDDVFFPVLNGAGTDCLQISAAIWLRQGNTTAKFAGSKTAKELLFLFVSTKTLDCCCHDEVGIEKARHRHPDRRNSFNDLGVGSGRQT